MKRKPWTGIQIRRLRECADLRLGLEQTVIIMEHRSESAILSKCKELGIKLSGHTHKPFTDAEDRQLRKWRAAKPPKSWKWMAEKTGRPKASLRARAYRLGI